MQKRIINEHAWLLGAVDWNRRLFDALIPLPDGTSYNAYLVQGTEKTALLDTVDPSKADVLLAQLANVDKVDYLVAHHAEQDHSGTIPLVLQRYPGATLITSPKGKGMLIDLLRIPEERIRTVTNGEIISLGGKTLEFIHTPWVHWPETMCSYLPEDGILFSCDFFGSHFATTDLYVQNQAIVYEAAKRYYAEIMMPFRTSIRKHLDVIKNRAVKLIAPSHGPLYAEPEFILKAYADWVSEEVKNEVVLPYVSMHGSTEAMIRHLVDALVERDVKVHPFDLAATDLGKLAIALVDAATLIVGTPTVHVGPHPAVFHAAHLANALRPKLRWASIIGSYGWSSQAVERIVELIPNLKVETLNPVICQGAPREKDFQALTALAEVVAAKHRGLSN